MPSDDVVMASEEWRKLSEAADVFADVLDVLTDPERTDRAARNRAIAILEAA